MQRIYDNLILDHLEHNRQMAFIAGPRQVGKTTTSLHLQKKFEHFLYFNWDIKTDREKIIQGPKAIAEATDLFQLKSGNTLIIFDEIHKYGSWKQFIKGFFDAYHTKCHIIITGSAKLNIFKSTGDSLMGRYFLYRVHPLSVGELLHTTLRESEIIPPTKISDEIWSQLFKYGGFPEPFLQKNRRFFIRWQKLRQEQLIREDIKSLSQIQEIAQLELLADLLKENACQLINNSSLANQINVSAPTVQRWLKCLESFYYCFSIRPWSKNVSRSLRKEPKYFLWDWSLINDKGKKVENLIAVHLLKSVNYWTDYGFGEYELFFLRDKEKREVDFLVTKDKEPWFMVEVKTSNNSGISKSLFHFQKQVKAKHAFQVIYEMDYVDQDCFIDSDPIIVPASTFLSQLI